MTSKDNVIDLMDMIRVLFIGAPLLLSKTNNLKFF